MWIPSVKKFLRSQSAVKYVINLSLPTVEVEEELKKSIVVLGNKNDADNIYSLFSNKDFCVLLNLQFLP